jgi:hypothetical protein
MVTAQRATEPITPALQREIAEVRRLFPACSVQVNYSERGPESLDIHIHKRLTEEEKRSN